MISLIKPLDESHVRSSRHKCVDNAQLTTSKMITYLYDACARIVHNALKENDRQSHQAYEPLLTFETIVDRVVDSVDFTSSERHACTAKNVATAGENLFHETGTCDVCCKDWRALQSIE